MAGPARAGFTLIELLVTVAIVGVLASVALPLAEITVKRAKEQELRVALREVRSGIDAYRAAVDSGHVLRTRGNFSGYPPNLRALVEGVEDAREPERRMIYFLRRLPRDPMATDPALDADKAWGLRCYESPYDDPRQGADVYDVYSLSDRTGLNGVPYREW